MSYLEVIVGVGIVATAAVIVWSFGSKKIKKTVTFLMPGERRGIELPITKETDYGLITKKTDGVTRRFIKLARGFNIKRGGGNYVTFFGLEGQVFTATPASMSARRSLAETLKFIWGDEFYDQIPDPERKMIEHGEIGVTVEVDPSDLAQLGIDPNDESEETQKILRMSTVDVNQESDALVLETIAQNTKPKDADTHQIWNMLIGAGLGAGVMLLLVVEHIVHVG